MNIHETIIFIHIYMPTHKRIHRYMYIYRHTNKIAILIFHVCGELADKY